MNIRRGRFSSVLEFISHQKGKRKGDEDAYHCLSVAT